MTDEQQDTSNKDNRKPVAGAAVGNNRGQRKNPPGSKPSNSISQPPSRSGSNKRPSSTPATESGSDSGKKANEGKKGEQRRQPQSGGGQGKANHRKGQSTTGQGSRQTSGQSTNKPGAAAPAIESSDALSSLQRVIADLKTTSPPIQSSPLAGNTLSTSTSLPITQTATSNLPANAPVFQPGASIYPPPNASEPPPRHRKAASMGTAGLSSSFNNFAPHLGSMREDVEEGQNDYEEGEIPDSLYSTQTQTHHPRSQSQTFTAPRFAALAAQQEQQQHNDVLGPSGRPQLAPNFMFGGGARRRPSAGAAMGPSISEEDVGFQFPQQLPQQQTVQSYSDQDMLQRRNEGSGEIRGIMAEQV
jgi:protein SSD1